jgi:hypothetical protein
MAICQCSSLTVQVLKAITGDIYTSIYHIKPFNISISDGIALVQDKFTSLVL